MPCSHRHEKPSLYEGIKDHWVVPVIGAVLMVGADFMQQPEPPVIDGTKPETQQKMTMMKYQQNLNIYSTRKAAMEKYGNLLLALGLGNAATSEAGKNNHLLAAIRSTQQHQTEAAQAATHAASVRAHRAM